MCCLMPVLLLTRSANQSNWFATPVRSVWCVQEVRSVRLVVMTNQTDLYVVSCPFSFSCVLKLVICITYTCMSLSHLFAPHKLRDIGKFHVSH
jgi:hypothetical protein